MTYQGRGGPAVFQCADPSDKDLLSTPRSPATRTQHFARRAPSGQMLLTSGDTRSLILLVDTVADGLLQERTESRRWSNRNGQEKNCP
jgi:hypothetical protein